MSLIDKLVADLAPGGVDSKPLGDVGELVRGSGMPKTSFTESGVGAIHYGQIYTHYGTATSETISFVAPETAERLKKVDPGGIIITNTSENLDDVGKAVAWLGDEQIVTGGHATIFKHDQDPRFIAYWLQSPSFQRQKKRLATGTKVMDVSAKQLAKIRIPVPPAEVQREIVRVLEDFSRSEAELEVELHAELKERRREYDHLRDALLTFGDDPEMPWQPMSEVGTFTRGKRFTKADVVPEGIASIHYGEIYTGYGVSADQTLSRVRPDMAPDLRFAKRGDVIIAGVGETVEDVAKAVAWLGDEDVAFHDDCWAFRSAMNPKFVAYYLQTRRFGTDKRKHVARAKVKRISASGLGRIQIPLPAREAQDQIVSFLDKFDALISELAKELRAELRARRTQFEHYRDELLTFEEAVA